MQAFLLRAGQRAVVAFAFFAFIEKLCDKLLERLEVFLGDFQFVDRGSRRRIDDRGFGSNDERS